MNWAKHQVAYDHVKEVAMAKLAYVEHVPGQPHMPEIIIAGPKGEMLTLPEKNQYMIISLWSVRCKDCILNLKKLKRLKQVFDLNNENWKIISVSIDKPSDLELVAKAIKKYNMPELAEYYDAKGALLKLVAPKDIPVAIIVNDDGRVLYKIYGNAPWLDADVITYLQTLLRVKDK